MTCGCPTCTRKQIVKIKRWMARRIHLLKWLAFVAVIYSCTLTVLFMYSNLSLTPCMGLDKSPTGSLGGDIGVNDYNLQNGRSQFVIDSNTAEWGSHKLVVIVPYRDRMEELFEFAPHIHQYLTKKHIRHDILVINQVDSLRFNRGSLINVGVLESSADCDYIAMHDVDLLPLSPVLNYSYPGDGPYHVSAPDLHPLYHYKTFIGGILLLTKFHFNLVNGLSNRYWGWGREDDELYIRLQKSGLLKTTWTKENGKTKTTYEIRRPMNISTGLKTFRHIHDKEKRPRDSKRYFNQKQKTGKLDRETGLNTIKYTVVKRHSLVVNGASFTMLDVKLVCDFEKTPWCLNYQDHHLLKKAPIRP